MDLLSFHFSLHIFIQESRMLTQSQLYTSQKNPDQGMILLPLCHQGNFSLPAAV
jgi:hypothetical protein